MHTLTGGQREEEVQKLSVAQGIIHKSCDKRLTGGTKYVGVVFDPMDTDSALFYL